MALRGNRSGTARRIPGAGMINSVLSALVLPIWLLTFLAWAVQLAGMAAVQHQQGGRFLQFDWFVTSLEFVVLMMMPFHLLARRSTPGIVAMASVVTVLEILRTNVWNNARLGRDSVTGGDVLQIDSFVNPGLTASSARVNTLLSGYLITSAFNCMLILALGSLPAYSHQDTQHLSNKGADVAEAHDRRNGHAGTASTFGNGTGGNVQGPGTHTTGPAPIDGAQRV